MHSFLDFFVGFSLGFLVEKPRFLVTIIALLLSGNRKKGNGG